MTVLFVAVEFLVVLSLFVFFGKKDYLSIALMENAFRVHLTYIFLIFLPLLFMFALYVGEIGRVPFYVNMVNLIRDAAGKQRLIMILTHVFLLVALLIVPLTTVFHLCFSYRRFLVFLDKQRVCVNDKIIVQLDSILKRMVKVTGTSAEPVLYIVGNDVLSSIPGFTGCGILGKGDKNLILLLSPDFVTLCRKGLLSEQEIEAIFLHELSHVLHRDQSVLLWARSFVPSKVFTIATACFSLSLFFGVLHAGLSTVNVLLLMFIMVSMYLFRAIMIHVTAHTIRQREHLADIHVALFYNRSAELIEAIKKMYLYVLPTGGLVRVSRFMGEFAAYGEEEYIEIAHNFKEIVKGLKQRFRDFLFVNVYWHSKASSRIRAVRDLRNVMADVGYFLSPFSIVGLCFLAVACLLTISASLTFLGVAPAVQQEISLYLSYPVATVLIFLNCLPLGFASTEVFRRAFVPASWKQLPKHFMLGKFWWNMHVNNLFIFTAGIVSLTVNGVLINLQDGIILFFVYTLLSVLFTVLTYIEKLRKEETRNEPFVSG
jgi:hypothetical protein